MNKLLLSITFITLFTLSSFAQLEKGSWIGGVSGNVDFTFLKSSSNQAFSFSLNPYAMYLVSKNFAVGLNLDYNYDFVKYSFESSTHKLLLAPVIHKYFGNSRYRPYVGLATGLAIYQTNSFAAPDWDVSKSTNFGYFLNPEAGISYWLNDKVFFDLKASYDLINYDKNSDNHTVDLKIGIGIKIGNPAPKE